MTGAPVAVDPTLHQSPYARHLARGFPWLRFETGLESAFRAEHYAANLVLVRTNLILALALSVGFTAIDPLVLPGGYDTYMRWLGLLGLALPLLLAILVTALRATQRHYPPVAGVLVPIVALAIAAIELRAESLGAGGLLAVLVLATIYVYYLVGLLFYAALRTNLLVLAFYAAGSLWLSLPPAVVLYNLFVLVAANLVGATVAYNLEQARRVSWLEAQLLSEIAMRDGLTGLANRRRLDEHLERMWQQGLREHVPIAGLMIDIDAFKPYNDRYGHQAGDEVLKQVARALAETARRPLDVVARYGGEEFAIVLFNPTREYATELAERVRAAVQALALPHAASPVAPVVTVSVGLAFVRPVAGRSPEGMIQLADEALYQAKEDGRNRIRIMDAEYEQLRTGLFRA